MADLTLVAETGRPTGSRPSRRLRHEGRIPGVVYGLGMEPVALSVAARDLRTVLSTGAGLNAVLSLELDGRRFTTMARELQRHPVRGTVTHVDFQVVDPDREVSADVAITLVGEPVELHRADGVLEQLLFALPIKARPADIPTVLELDISGLVIGAAVRVADIALPRDVTTDLDPEAIVAAGQPPRVQTAEGEGAEGEGAEGAAPAEAGAGDGSAAES
ncbi:MAG TPA: 50S ribosomal protein L25 [Acidimicrobiales bacterium]|nr:50S ribosomal protein L25 [Acidimicrobiales bacterium]